MKLTDEVKTEISTMITEAVDKAVEEVKKGIPEPIMVENEEGEKVPFDVAKAIAGITKSIDELKETPILKSEGIETKIENLEKSVEELKKNAVESEQDGGDPNPKPIEKLSKAETDKFNEVGILVGI